MRLFLPFKRVQGVLALQSQHGEGVRPHHQPRRTLEGRFCIVLVLGLDELSHYPLCGFERAHVGGQAHNQLVDVPQERAEPRAWVSAIPRTISKRLQQRPELAVLRFCGDAAPVLIHELSNGADLLLGQARDAYGVEVQPSLSGDPEDGLHRAHDEPVGVLKETHPLLALCVPLFGDATAA